MESCGCSLESLLECWEQLESLLNWRWSPQKKNQADRKYSHSSIVIDDSRELKKIPSSHRISTTSNKFFPRQSTKYFSRNFSVTSSVSWSFLPSSSLSFLWFCVSSTSWLSVFRSDLDEFEYRYKLEIIDSSDHITETISLLNRISYEFRTFLIQLNAS